MYDCTVYSLLLTRLNSTRRIDTAENPQLVPTVCSHTCSQHHISAITHKRLSPLAYASLVCLDNISFFLDLWNFHPSMGKPYHDRIHPDNFERSRGNVAATETITNLEQHAAQTVNRDSSQPICDAGHNLIPRLITQQQPPPPRPR